MFGRARPASGFDSDLKVLAKLSTKEFTQKAGIVAPNLNDEGLRETISKLREQGEIVIVNLADQLLDNNDQQEMNCDRQLVNKGGAWVVETL